MHLFMVECWRKKLFTTRVVKRAADRSINKASSATLWCFDLRTWSTHDPPFLGHTGRKQGAWLSHEDRVGVSEEALAM